MRVVKCEQGHFFDIDTYDECPICGAGMAAGESKQDTSSSWQPKGGKSVSESSAIGGLRGLRRFFEKSTSTETEVRNDVVSKEHPISACKPKEAAVEKDVSIEPEETESMYKSAQEFSGEEKTEYMFSNNSDEEPTLADDLLLMQQRKEDKKEVAYSVNPAVESLQEAVHQVSASDDGKTMSFFSAALDSANSNDSTSKRNAEPVVGWLVCVSGSHFGEGFSIHAGMNSIGRNASNSIVISKDGSVSREKHAFIVYEPKKREFYIKPGESSGLTYVNDDYITDTVKIKNKDIVEVGNSKMIFVPLCDDGFSWEDYMNNK